MDRRRFVGMTACALLAGGGVSACASLATVPVETRNGRIRLRLRDHPALESPGGHIRVQPAGHPTHLLVFALPDERFSVVSPVCTHRQCIVDVSGSRIVCPCHGSEYDRSGDVLVGPAERPLKHYPAELTPENELVIRLVEGGST